MIEDHNKKQDEAPEVYFSGTLVKFESKQFSDSIAAEIIIDYDKPFFQLIEGKDTYQTHTADKNSNDEFVLAHPFEMNFYFDRDVTWPRLLINFNRLDYTNKIDTVGHAICQLPKTAGFHTMRLKAFKQSGTTTQEIKAAYSGQNQTLESNWMQIHSDLNAKPEKKQTVSSTYIGDVTIECEVIIRNADLYRVDKNNYGTSVYKNNQINKINSMKNII